VGTWGTQVFDSDHACDYLGDIVGPLIVAVRQGIGALSGWDNHYAVEKIVPSIACLRALAQAFSLNVQVHLQRSQVERWRDRYLEWFDETEASAWRTPEGAAEFRKNAETEFNLLIEQLTEWPADEWDLPDTFRREFQFTLWLAAECRLTEDEIDYLRRIGMRDATFSTSNGGNLIDVVREDSSLDAAVRSAILMASSQRVIVARVEIEGSQFI
jgi:hypothetical protein